ncbi:MAG TPA: NAD(P)-dependent alcohol dehydrogenase [Streptosporangiaceae bacterium]|nr:NAD(P)-dependent alcohol dehydrogenase [Streptosporangiaceae bacterium]
MTANAVPETMRVSVLRAAGQLELADRPVPRPGPGQVLVAVRSVGVCGSDVHYFEHGRIGDFVVRAPLVLGHEASGRIAAVGAGVDGGRVGARVAIEPGAACGACRECRAGRYNLCPDMRFFATPPVDGALAQYVAVRADLAFDLPDAVSDDDAALLEPLSVGIWATGKAQVTAGSSVLIAGAGPIGLVAAQVARARGATTIAVTDLAPERLAAALRNGATRALAAGDAAAAGTEFDAFLDCSGAPAAISAGIAALRPAGRAVLVGMGPDEITVPLGRLQQRELTVTGTFRYAHTWPAAIGLAASGRVDLPGLVTGRFGLADAELALRSATRPGTIKSIIEPWR